MKASFTDAQQQLFDLSQQRQQQQQAPAQAEAQAAAEQVRATADFAGTVNNSINKLTATLTNFFGGEGRDRSGTEITTEELENALDITKTKTEENTQAIEKATIDQVSQSETLKTSLGEATIAMVDLKGGVSVQLEAMQDLNIKVDLTESVQEFKSEMETIARNMAESALGRALQELASNTTDQDRQKEVNDTLESLR